MEKSLVLLKKDKRRGHDGISPKILKLASKELELSMTKIYNKFKEDES